MKLPSKQKYAYNTHKTTHIELYGQRYGSFSPENLQFVLDGVECQVEIPRREHSKPQYAYNTHDTTNAEFYIDSLFAKKSLV